MTARRTRQAFTLIELLVSVAIIAILISLIAPAMSAARQQGRAAKCLSQLRVLGQGLTMYTLENQGILVPGRLPKVDDESWFADIKGGRKYRPTFLAMMGSNIGTAPFDDPMPYRTTADRFGQPGDRQNYADPIFVCPSVSDWTDERNGSYGYNYQFLGNSRLRDPDDDASFKNWPVMATRIRDTANTVVVADCMGTAAAFPPEARGSYENNARDDHRWGNEGFNLDPPNVDPANGEMAGFSSRHRSAADPRHRNRAAVLWLDGHGDAQTLERLGYELSKDGTVGFNGDNARWSGTGRNVAWTHAID
ncbi:MAG: prepilin-type N-terminal cleavage/methylation domain-containing protein [Phycisphaerales bacterium]|nr:prepilin-type N-terminal cleavage/methylation domain-containing protein [Phycisphaerales bacterium]